MKIGDNVIISVTYKTDDNKVYKWIQSQGKVTGVAQGHVRVLEEKKFLGIGYTKEKWYSTTDPMYKIYPYTN